MQQYIAYGLFFVAFVAVIADLNLSFNVPEDRSYLVPEDPGYGYREGALFMVGIVLALIGWLIY
jgi:hypothetical protein